jgi:hypothetical protein
MRVINDYGLVRIVSDGDPLKDLFDIKVEVNKDEEWYLYHGFNSFTDDYAYTNAREAASRAIKLVAAARASQLPGVKV